MSATPGVGQIADMPAAPRLIELPSLAATVALATAVAGLARAGDIILLAGPLGAGKTAFARAFLRAASGDPALEVPSPTFTLMQSYDTRFGTVHHFDFWRLDGPNGIAELGWQEIGDGVTLVEWPDRLGPLYPDDALSVTLEINGDETRRALLSGWPDRLASIA